MYGFIISLANNENESEVLVTIVLGSKKNEDQLCVSDVGATIDDFLCSGSGGTAEWMVVVAYAVLISQFLLPDLVRAVRTFRVGPAVSIAIVLEVVVAVAASNFFVSTFVKSAGPLDTIFAAVAVIFIHDLDEKVYASFGALSDRMKVILAAICLVGYTALAVIVSTASN